MTPFDELLKKTEGELTSRREAELDAELKTDAQLQNEQRRVDQLIAAVAKPDPALEGIDLRDGLWARPVPEKQVSLRGWPVLAVFGALAAVVFAYFMLPGLNEEFREKGSSGSLSGFEVFVVQNGKAQLLGDTVHRGDALGFAYRNQPDSPNRALAIYAVDSVGRVFWFYPEWREGQPPPSSIAIGTSLGRVELPDAVAHDFAPGKLLIYAIFTPEPVSVLDIEAGRVKPLAAQAVEVLP